jgi:hypothetical protein
VDRNENEQSNHINIVMNLFENIHNMYKLMYRKKNSDKLHNTHNITKEIINLLFILPKIYSCAKKTTCHSYIPCHTYIQEYYELNSKKKYCHSYTR